MGGQALPSSTEQGQALACFLHEIFLTKKKILKFWGGHGPPSPPTNKATGTEQGQALPSSTEKGQALACFLHEIFLTKKSEINLEKYFMKFSWQKKNLR